MDQVEARGVLSCSIMRMLFHSAHTLGNGIHSFPSSWEGTTSPSGCFQVRNTSSAGSIASRAPCSLATFDSTVWRTSQSWMSTRSQNIWCKVYNRRRLHYGARASRFCLITHRIPGCLDIKKATPRLCSRRRTGLPLMVANRGMRTAVKRTWLKSWESGKPPRPTSRSQRCGRASPSGPSSILRVTVSRSWHTGARS